MRPVIALCLAAILTAGCGEEKKPDPAPASQPAPEQGKQPQQPPDKNAGGPGFN